jgi:hypothetical protein
LKADVEIRLPNKMEKSLREIAASLSSPVEKRLFAEYGALLVSKATPPATIIFANAAQVEAFQSSLNSTKAKIGEYEIELQAEAMATLLGAAREVERRGGTLTPRAADSARRSYEETVSLWRRNVNRGLQHWQKEGRIDKARVSLIQALEPVEQVAVILELEVQEQIYFGTFFNRSILYSVAAPGASQHLTMLAFDVQEYRHEVVEAVLNEYGWHRTVLHDLPHFTYLGYREEDLPQLGLKRVTLDSDERTFRFWIPDV